MQLSIKENSRNYACSVVEIKDLFPIEGADKIQRCLIFGNDIVCSKDVKVGDKMLYFVSGTKLNKYYCKYNNLLDKAELNNDTSIKGFISSKQMRCKAIKLRGVISNGMLMPMHSLDAFHLDLKKGLNVGDEFTDINGISICEKYIVQERESNQGSAKTQKSHKLKELILDSQFRFHHETEHFAKNVDKFKPDTEIIITRKLHGSSLILANVLINKKLSLKDKIAKFIGLPIQAEEYGLIWSSGKPKGRLPKGLESTTNKWETSSPNYYHSDIWGRAYKEIGHKVEKGISIYAEIVGKGIQGDMFTYNQDYGIHVYRITSTSVDGNVVEFSWEQVKKYCFKYGLIHVQEYFSGKVNEFVESGNGLLADLHSTYLNKSYSDCKIDEGVCIRIRETDEIFKLKSPNFIKMESEDQENGVENVEDAQ